ncbi:hypothetical protein M758_6G196400 [Ceratodon purpureus]|nr:hypothetical protein M758_6G196400 [Ceratodon purpureus]
MPLDHLSPICQFTRDFVTCLLLIPTACFRGFRFGATSGRR